jgi:hypothetical protein
MSSSSSLSYHLIDKRFPIPRVEKYAELDVCLQDYHIIMNSTKLAFHEQIYIVQIGKTGLIEFIYTLSGGAISKTKYSANNFVASINNNNPIEDSGLKVDLGKKNVEHSVGKMQKSVSFNDADLSGGEKHKRQMLEQEMKALEKQEQETLKLLKDLEFHAIKRTFTDYANYRKMPDAKVAEQIYVYMADMLKNDGCVKCLEELAKIDIEEVWRTQEHGLSPDIVKMCKQYDAEMRRVRKNFSHQWDAFESDTPISANIEIKTKV